MPEPTADAGAGARIIVVGAGLAGLTAADELARAGHEVVVLEARDRVGGRVHSRTLDNGAVVEMGAEFILPGCDAVLELVERFGLGLWSKGMRYGRREPRGVDVGGEELDEAARLIGFALDSGVTGSAAELVAGLPLQPGAREAVLARAEVSAAAPADQVPAAELGGLASLSDEPAPSVVGGNGRLAEALAAELAGRVELAEPVRALRWGGEGVLVRTESGEVKGAACVIAVPASVIGAIDFDPPLPGQMAEALAAVRYGHAAKLFVPLRSAALPSATLAVPDRYWAWTATGADGALAQPVLSTFAGSAPALSRLGLDDGPARWLEKLALLRPDLDLDPGEALLSTWDDDPWSAAAYSLAPDPATLATLATGASPLAFAGEHTAPELGALMEGAIRSGRRAAADVAAFLR